MDNYQSVLQSTLVAHQNQVQKIDDAFEEGQMFREKVAIGTAPLAHVLLQTGIDKGIKFVSSQIAKRTGSKALTNMAADYEEGGVQRVVEGVLNRRIASSRVSPLETAAEGDSEFVEVGSPQQVMDQAFSEMAEQEDPYTTVRRTFDIDETGTENEIQDITEQIQQQNQIQETQIDNEIEPVSEEEEDEFFDTEDTTPLIEQTTAETTGVATGEGTGVATGEATGVAAGEATGITAGEATGEAVAVGLSLDPVTAVIGIGLGAGIILGTIFSSDDHPAQPKFINPSFQRGS
jgi:hypothetical protein